MKEKVLVDVMARFHGGRVQPVSLTLQDGRRFSVDRILDVRRAASRSGGAGIRYTCLIQQRRIPLYFDEWENVWWYDA